MKKLNGFSFGAFAASTLVCLGTLIFSGCQNDLLESPSFQTRGSYSTGRVAAPTNVTATQGGFKSITLKWTAAKNATRYEISTSDTATGDFTFLDFTQDATCSFTLSEEQDVKKYFKIRSIRAIDSTTDEYSEQYSQTCFGTTLATPIITSIKQNANGDAITVRWYKGVNCTTDTYLNSNLIYSVILYNADGTQVIREETISAMDVKDAASTKYAFTNLTPNTEYNVQVKAYTKTAQDTKSTENSNTWPSSTAHSLIPAAPENLEVSKGTSKSEVAISWTLPKFAEIKSSTAFETRPVYFKVYRKLESASENAYEPIVTYLGTTETDSPAKTAIHFTKTTDAEGNPATDIKTGESLAESKGQDESGNEITIPAKIRLTVEYPTEETETDPNYTNYLPGTKITLFDTTVSRGQKYSYRIQSFIDDNGKKTVTSDESYSDDTGWLINSPTVSISSTYEENKEDENLIDSFTVTLNFKFDDFDQPYNYVVTETCQKMIKATPEEIENGTHTEDYPDPESPETKVYSSSTSYEHYFPWKKTYEPLKDETNKYLLYTYDVAVCPKDSGNDDTANYIKVSASGSVIVINDKSMIPDVSSFKVKDGYKDRFELSWKYDPNCKYKLSWKNTDKNGNETYNEYEFKEEDFLDDDGNQIESKTDFVYKHKAESGDIRKEYTLYADNGLKNYQTAVNETSEDEKINVEFKTLGTPEPYFEPSYATIKVIWPAVQMADSTKYAAKYKFSENEEKTISKDDIKTDDEGKTFYCEITKPYGETTVGETTVDNVTDARISGKDIEFVLTAESAADTCDTTIPVSTLGPANLGLKISGERKTITLEWNKVEGASGYLIFRRKYINDYFENEDNKGDLYYYEPNSENGVLSLISSDEATPSKCQPNSSSTFKFTDIYQSVSANDYNNQYKTDQAQLAWGLPYGYTVIPVKRNSDFEFNDLVINGTTSSIAYTQESLLEVEQKGATYGYGLAINASKATTDKKVKVSWKRPYNTTKTPILLYRGYSEKDGSKWTQDEEYNGKNTDLSAECKPEESCKAYDYFVYYNFETNLEIDPYYEYFLAQRTDSDDEKENKGYILSFETPKATYAGSDTDTKSDPNYYAEKFTWKTANFSIYKADERKKIPDSIKILMLNTNKSNGWTEIAEIDPITLKATANAANCSAYDLDIDTTDANSITVAPYGIKNNGATNTDGLLKVLRDAKHYYAILGSRTVDGTTIYANAGYDGSVYGYRQITDEELVKATMLVIADLIEDSGMLGELTGTVFGDCKPIYGYNGNDETGKFTWEQDGSSRFDWKLTSFTYGWKKFPYADFSELNSDKTIIPNFISITDSDTLSGDFKRGRKNAKTLEYLSIRELEGSFLGIKSYKDFDLSKKIPVVTTTNNIPLSSYSSTVKFAAKNDTFAAEVWRNNTKDYETGTISGAENVKKWIPANINGNGYQGQNSAYGWWED